MGGEDRGRMRDRRRDGETERTLRRRLWSKISRNEVSRAPWKPRHTNRY